jgi:hypothetical protein
MNLNDRALLVTLNIGGWAGRKLDKQVTQDVARSNGVSSSAGRYNKSLLPTCAILGDIHGMAGDIRNEFYYNTLPWGIEGTFILPTNNYLGFTQNFRAKRSEWFSLVDQFANEYPQLKLKAQQDLGPLYCEADYPAAEQMRNKFYMDMHFFPVPSKDFRVQIASDELDRIRLDVEQQVKNAQAVAMKDLWNRVYKKVEHIAQKLADPKAIFRDSMIDNARELCDLLPKLNFNDDPQLETLRQEIEGKLLKNPELLRLHPEVRRDTAAEAKAIMDKMSAIMGGM